MSGDDYGYAVARRARGRSRSAPDIGSEPPEWVYAALCAEIDPDLMYPEKGASPNPARRICAACTVTQDCLAEALQTPRVDDFGVRGGTTAQERIKLRHALSSPAPVSRPRAPRPATTGEHTCGQCGRSFSTGQGAAVHRRRVHEGFNPRAQWAAARRGAA